MGIVSFKHKSAESEMSKLRESMQDEEFHQLAVFADPQSRFRRDYLRNPANNCSKSNKYNDFWYSKDSGNFKKCVFSSFMEQVGREQMSHALKLITDDSKTIDRLIHNQEFGFNGLIEDWKRLSGFNTVEAGHDFHQEHLECGFVAIEKKFDHQWEEYQRREGYFNGCDNMCPLLKILVVMAKAT